MFPHMSRYFRILLTITCCFISTSLQAQNKTVVVVPFDASPPPICPAGQKLCVDTCVSIDDFPARADFHYVDDFVDFRLQGKALDTWHDVTDRVINFDKCSDNSLLRITYQDTLGRFGDGLDQCVWRIIVNDVSYSEFSVGDSNFGGWSIDNGAHIALVPGISSGPVTVKVQNRYHIGATSCLSGWNTEGEFLSVEEF